MVLLVGAIEGECYSLTQPFLVNLVFIVWRDLKCEDIWGFMLWDCGKC